MPAHFTIGPVTVGKPLPFRGEERSAIVKQAADGPVSVGPLGLAGDDQADKVHHGGVDMAVHHYPTDHYAHWGLFLDGHPLLMATGAFGENISTIGLTESDVCIGDIFRLGSALVQVSQGRKPCWKIDHKFGRKGITAKVVKTGKAGWYYRVLEPGMVERGDTLERVEQPHPEWSVARTFRLIVAGGHKQDRTAIEQLATLEPLSADWRAKAAKFAAM